MRWTENDKAQSGYFLAAMITAHFGAIAWIMVKITSPIHIVAISMTLGLLIVAIEAVRTPQGNLKTKDGWLWLRHLDLLPLTMAGCIAGAGLSLLYHGLDRHAVVPLAIAMGWTVWFAYRLVLGPPSVERRNQELGERERNKPKAPIVVTDPEKLRHWKAVIAKTENETAEDAKKPST